jgi:hypothetical protein
MYRMFATHTGIFFFYINLLLKKSFPLPLNSSEVQKHPEIQKIVFVFIYSISTGILDLRTMHLINEKLT